jgi:hypothetical protein
VRQRKYWHWHVLAPGPECTVATIQQQPTLGFHRNSIPTVGRLANRLDLDMGLRSGFVQHPVANRRVLLCVLANKSGWLCRQSIDLDRTG